jgi:hypothetical protein
MSIKQLSFLTAIGAIAVSTATSALAESTTHSPITFSCEVSSNGVPTTILKSADSQKTIFNWNSDRISEARNLIDLCNEVTAKLNNYAADQNHDLSVLTFKADVQVDLPAICATDEPGACNKLLFTLPRTEEPGTVANGVLEDILDPQLQTTKQVSDERGLQSVSHSINIWELILGRKVVKSF